VYPRASWLENRIVAGVHRSHTHVSTEKSQVKLDRLVAQPTLATDADLETASEELTAEMEAAWLEDWSEI
jgi:hypothetical protein